MYTPMKPSPPSRILTPYLHSHLPSIVSCHVSIYNESISGVQQGGVFSAPAGH